ncbi:MAG: glycoside hydrolase family 16 protein [Spirochaetia bacterium]|nr:glycoside hydrolase family 16 protein [Spirochaetia bacterium]
MIALPEAANFIEIKAKLADGTTVASRSFVGLGKGGNDAPAWKTGFIFTDGVGQGTLGSAWGFRSNGTSKPNLTYPGGSDLMIFHTFGIATDGSENFFFDGGNKKIGNDIISTGNSYQFNLGQDEGPTAQGTVFIDYVAFYKAGGFVPDPESTQRIFLDEPVSGTVIKADGIQGEAEYDMMVGNKVFKSVYIDDFSGYDNNIENFWAKKMTIPAELGGEGTEVDAWRRSPGNFNVESGADAVKIKDNQLILSVLKIDTNENSADYNKYIAPYADYNGNRKAQIDARRQVIVGGLFWNHKWLYGYIEATIKMVYKYKSVWCGFYTYGLKESRFGHEIDIYEPHLTTAADQIIHYPKDGGNGRVASWINSPAIDTSQFVRTAVAWSPDKVTFYLNDNETGSIKEGEYGKLTDRDGGLPPSQDMPAAGLNVIPDTPQDVHLDIASNGDLGGYAGESRFADPQTNWTEPEGQSYDFIYFKSFKVYNYVGELVTE